MRFETKLSRNLAASLSGVVQTPFVLRVLLPGLGSLLLLVPVLDVSTLERLLSASLSGAGQPWLSAFLVLLAALVAGTLASISSPFIVDFATGKAWSGTRHFRRGVVVHKLRIRRLRARAKAARQQSRNIERKALWKQLRDYPESPKGNPTATHPTLFGNLCESIVSYPWNRYGMDEAFFWPRLRQKLPTEVRSEIEARAAIVAGLLSLSALSVAGTGLWAGATVIFEIRASAHAALPFPSSSGLHSYLFGSAISNLLGALGLLFLAWLLYRLAILHQRESGEMEKAAYDLFRGELDSMSVLGPDEKERWHSIWLFLQYYGVVCSTCKTQYRAREETCPGCGEATDTNLRAASERLLSGYHPETDSRKIEPKEGDHEPALRLSGQVEIPLRRR